MHNNLKRNFINDTTLHPVSALKTSLLPSTLLKEFFFFLFQKPKVFLLNELNEGIVVHGICFVLIQTLASVINLCNFTATRQNPYFSPEKEKNI